MELFEEPRKKGDLINLKNSDGTHLLIEIIDVHNGNDEDFSTLKDKLEEKFLKQREKKLNAALFKRLREKYKPIIHTDRLTALNDNNNPETREAVIVEIEDIKVTGTRLLQFMDKQRIFFRGRSGQALTTEKALQSQIIENIITQTLIGKESLARHYEKKPPFNKIYDFYRRNRLTIEWKKAVIAPQVVISEADVESEYERMADHLKQPEELDIAWVRTANRKLAQKVQQELMEGGDFFKVMIPRFGSGVEMKKAPVGKLDPLLQNIVADLAPGQVSQAVESGDEIFFVKLIRRHQGQPTALSKVAADLRESLRKKRSSTLEKEMLDRLRDQSSVKIRQHIWKRVRKKLLEESLRSDKN